MKKVHFKHTWFILAAYGVWFAVFSGVEELTNGKYWKVILSFILGLLIYLVIERKLHKE